jgi:hypothetical protein
LRIETPAAAVEVDDIRLVGSARPGQRTEWLLQLAFEARPITQLEESGMLVATDAPEAFAQADLHRLIEDMHRVRKWVKRVFGPVIRPVEGEGPVMLLIFSKDENRNEFLERLGTAWRATLPPPQAAGFTVQDLCTATYDPQQGPRRPVYLHESVHGVLAHDLRLPSGHLATSPLQEGIANYLQLCVYPRSLDARTFTVNFNGPIDPSGRGFFKPLKQLFDQRATAQTYAQLSSLVGYLVEENPTLLQAMAAGLAEGQSAQDVLLMHQTNWDALEKAWLQWGRLKFPEKSPLPPRFFTLPAEFE